MKRNVLQQDCQIRGRPWSGSFPHKQSRSPETRPMSRRRDMCVSRQVKLAVEGSGFSGYCPPRIARSLKCHRGRAALLCRTYNSFCRCHLQTSLNSRPLLLRTARCWPCPVSSHPSVVEGAMIQANPSLTSMGCAENTGLLAGDVHGAWGSWIGDHGVDGDLGGLLHQRPSSPPFFVTNKPPYVPAYSVWLSKGSSVRLAPFRFASPSSIGLHDCP